MLRDVLPILVKLSKKFQSSMINFAHLKPSLEAAKSVIQALKDAPGPQFLKTEPFIQSLRSEDSARDIIPVTDRGRAQFVMVRKAYTQVLLDCLQQRFPMLPVLSALSIFDTRNLPHKDAMAQYGKDHLEVLIERLSDKGQGPYVDADDCRHEWLMLKAAMTTHPTIKATGSVPELVKVLATHHEGEYPNLIKMADWALAKALSTADCERDFSVLKLIKTARRNSLSNKSLEQIMAIKIDAQTCKD